MTTTRFEANKANKAERELWYTTEDFNREAAASKIAAQAIASPESNSYPFLCMKLQNWKNSGFSKKRGIAIMGYLTQNYTTAAQDRLQKIFRFREIYFTRHTPELLHLLNN